MAFYYSISAGLFILALGYGYYAARSNQDLKVENALRRSHGIILFSALLLVAVSVSLTAQFHDPFCKLLPLPVQRFVSWITWGLLSALGAVVSAYTLGLALVQNHAQKGMLMVAVILLNGATVLSSLRFLSPIAAHLGAQKMRGGIVLQSRNSTCAAATLANIAHLFGDNLTEREAAEMLLTSRLGTGIGPIRYSLDKLGYQFETLDPEVTKSLTQVVAPAILFIDHPGVGREAHAVAYIGERQGHFEIWDPISGRVFWDQIKMDKVWHGNGISCSRQGPNPSGLQFAEKA